MITGSVVIMLILLFKVALLSCHSLNTFLIPTWRDSTSEEYDFDVDAFRKDLSLGKDKELFYATIDLNWLFQSLADVSLWRNCVNNCLQWLSHKISTVGTDREQDELCHQNAIEILSYIRKIHKGSTLKCFQGSLSQAETYARYEGKMILIYVEDGSFYDPSVTTVSFRLALSDPLLGSYINDNFIFFAGRTNHRGCRRMIESFGLKHSRAYPFLTVTSPSFTIDNKTGQFNKVKGTNLSIYELKRYPTTAVDIKASKIQKYLQK